MPGGGAIRMGEAYVELTAADSKLRQALDAAGSRIRSWGAGVMKAGAGVMGAGAAITAPLIAAARTFAESGSAMKDMSDRTGVAVAALSELKYAAGLSGATVEDLEGGIRKMQKSIAEAAGGNQEAAASFAALGLSAGRLLRLPGEDQLMLIAEALDRVPDPASRAALAMDVLGKGGTSLLPMMQGGAAGLAALRAEAQRLGLVMSAESAESADQLGDAFDRLGMATGSLWKTLGSAVAPALTEQVTWLTSATLAVKRYVASHKDVVSTAYQVGGALVIAGQALSAVGVSVYGVGLAVSGLSKMLGVIGGVVGFSLNIVRAAFTVTATVITTVFSAAIGVIQGLIGVGVAAASPWILVGAAVLALGGYLLWTSGAGQGALDSLAGAFQAFKATVLTTWSGVMDALAAGDLTLAWRVGIAGAKVLWAQLVAYLRQVWQGFVEWISPYLEGAWDGMKLAAVNAWAGVMSAAENARAAINTSGDSMVADMIAGWYSLKASILSIWYDVVHQVAIGMAVVLDKLGMMPEGAPLDKVLEEMDRQTKAKKEALQKEAKDMQDAAATDKRNQARINEEKRKEAQKQIEKDRQRRDRDVIEGRDKARQERQERFEQQRQDDEVEIDDAQAELDAARQEAADARAKVDAEQAKKQRDMQRRLGLGGIEAAADKFSSAGTFSAAASRGLGYASDLPKRQLQATEQVRDEVAGLREDVRDRPGPAFQ